ncbi:MAG: RNA polymerase sigma factor [Bacteroidia bacterium]|nr:RNA polymerase sigma factor [Bacteroidia bacterium]NNF31017.1 RNA polymerase sigma factor [Flavobacteriaceae bacterium]MBT8276867.1 RNA polymerase sigma factor [Bacteroidia bacterium]NNJ82437.1 RNA polymerase sigma factor [Flavobacteriaceae bacterium]NNK53085.1 RNA polymerase sigma factor [Flavobacteriaceae bacterium]
MQEELTLINQMKARDERALSALYDNYSGALYGVIIRICRNEAHAQDLLQETFIKIWQKCDSYDPEKGRFYTWAYRIARNTTLNSLRNRPDLIQNEDLSVYDNKEEQDDTPIDLTQLNGSIKKLEAHHQEALGLVYFKGLTHREAHKEMDVPLGTFKSYVRQALTQLRKSYELLLVVGIALLERIL